MGADQVRRVRRVLPAAVRGPTPLKLLVPICAFAVGAGLLVAAGLAAGGTSAGGTLRINLSSDVDFVDPALAFYSVSWELEYATCLKLLNYPDAEAPLGSQLVPEGAAALPSVSSDGTTYRFTIRRGLKSNLAHTLGAVNFAAAFARDRNPAMESPAAAFLADVAEASAKGSVLTIKLTRARPDFLSRIAMPFFCAIPKDLPVNPDGVDTLESWGPYYVSARTPERSIELTRNPNYRGPRPHSLDRIVYSVGVSPDVSLQQVEQGQADYAADGLAPAAYAGLAAKYGVNRSRFFVKPELVLRYLALNTDRPLFRRNPSLRRAVGYAIDRPALLRQLGAFAGTVATHYLPPGMPGYTARNVYPTGGPDLATAKRLAQGHTRDGTAVLYTCNLTVCADAAETLKADFGQIGIDLQVKMFPRATQFEKEATAGESFDVAYETWIADYADPFDLVNVLLDGRTIHARNNSDLSYFNDALYNRRMDAASKLTGNARYTAYGRLDIDLATHAAPLQAWGYGNDRILVSARVRNVVFNPIYGVDLAALALR